MYSRTIRIFSSLFLAIALIAGSAVPAAHAAPGDLDTTFDSDGKVTTDLGGGDVGRAVALQSDGKIVVAGYSNGTSFDFAVARYTSNGSLDTTFDTDGKVTTAIGSGDDSGYAVALQSDGKIVVAGSSNNGSNDDFAVVRYNSNGSLDTTFDTDGIVTTAIGNLDDVGYAVAIHPTGDPNAGKIVVAGYSWNGSNYDFAVVRYNSNGSLDTGFDSDGIVTTAFGSSDDGGYAVAIQSDGKIVVAGYSWNGSNNDFAVVRYNSNGGLDTGFDTDGKVTTAIGSGNDTAYAVAIQSDGKIVVAGSSNNGSNYDFAVVRYNSNGGLDTTFGTGGKVTTPVGSANDYGYAVAIQSDGKIVVAGNSNNGGTNDDFAVVRYNSNGGLDTGFDTDGKVTTAIGGSNDTGHAVAIQSDGKIVVAGFSSNRDYDFAVVRYQAAQGGGPSGTAQATVSVVSEGSLAVTPQDIAFPQVTLTGADVTANATPPNPLWQAGDTTNTGAGWHVTLSAGDFTDASNHTIAVANFKVQMAASDITTVIGNAAPTSQVTTATALSATGISILSAALNAGMGVYDFLPHYSLLVPGTTTFVGSYSTTVNVTMVAGP